MTMLPHPLYFAYWEGAKAYDPTSTHTEQGNFWNTQLTSQTTPSTTELMEPWMAIAQRWRLTYQAVTIYQDGPDLANQGTIVVSQSPMQPALFHCNSAGYNGGVYPALRLALFEKDTEGPNFQRSQAMPNAYMGRSREGAYVPLKLTDTCQDWQSKADLISPFSSPSWEIPSAVTTLPTTNTHSYPFWDVPGMIGNVTEGVITLSGQCIPSLCNGTVANISARNLSDQTSFTFYFRTGFEMQLAPSSTFTPQLKLSPPYDPVALDTYFAISRELKDAYPADYNDLGKMWDVISKAIRTSGPALQNLPLAKYAAPFVRAGLDIGDSVRKTRLEQRGAAGRGDEKPSAGEKEAAQEQVQADRLVRKMPGLFVGRSPARRTRVVQAQTGRGRRRKGKNRGGG